jgi:hypothetical protein
MMKTELMNPCSLDKVDLKNHNDGSASPSRVDEIHSEPSLTVYNNSTNGPIIAHGRGFECGIDTGKS